MMCTRSSIREKAHLDHYERRMREDLKEWVWDEWVNNTRLTETSWVWEEKDLLLDKLKRKIEVPARVIEDRTRLDSL